MEQQDISKLNRKDLLSLILSLNKENDELKEKIDSLQKEVDTKEIKLSNCGSLAEASLQLNDIFTKADEAAAQYLENVKNIENETMRIKLEAQTSLLFTQQKCVELEENTKQRCQKLEEESAQKCTQLVANAKAEADQYQADVMDKVNHLKEEYQKVFSIFDSMSSLKDTTNE